MTQPCFDNVVAQAIHKYANILLLVFISVLAWWGSNIDSKVTAVMHEVTGNTSKIEDIKDLRNSLITLRIQFGALESINVTLKAHEETLKRIEGRLDRFINRESPFKETQ